MPVTDAQRRGLHARLEDVVGAEYANVMMELLPPVGWSDVARQPLVDARLTELSARITVLEGKVDGLVARLAAVNAVTSLATAMATAGLVLGAMKLA